MAIFNKPTNLNGAELLLELNAVGINITLPPTINGDGKLFLDIADADIVKAEGIVSAHNGTITPVKLTVDKKLANLGLSIDDLKAALGL
jgi:hypothetical protein